MKGENPISGHKASLPTCLRISENWELPKHGVHGTSLGTKQLHIALRHVLASVQKIGHQVERLGINNEIISPEFVPLEGVYV